MIKTQPSSINLRPPDGAWPPDAPYPHAAQASSARRALDSLLNRARLQSFPHPAGKTPALLSAASRLSPISDLRSPAQSASAAPPPRLRASAGTPFPIRPRSSALGRTAATAFSLIEMLVVIAIIAILTGLAVPAFKGLVGVSGIRGGSDAILGALDQTRAEAQRSGHRAYLAFPQDTFSRFIIIDQTIEVLFYTVGNTTRSYTNTNPVVLTPRWFKLPTGIQLSFTNATNLFTNIDFSSSNAPAQLNLTKRSLPRLSEADAPVVVRAIRYDRFGSLPSGVDTNLQLLVGEGYADGTNVTFTGPTNTRAVFTAQRLTGKWIPSTNN